MMDSNLILLSLTVVLALGARLVECYKVYGDVGIDETLVPSGGAEGGGGRGRGGGKASRYGKSGKNWRSKAPPPYAPSSQSHQPNQPPSPSSYHGKSAWDSSFDDLDWDDWQTTEAAAAAGSYTKWYLDSVTDQTVKFYDHPHSHHHPLPQQNSQERFQDQSKPNNHQQHHNQHHHHLNRDGKVGRYESRQQEGKPRNNNSADKDSSYYPVSGAHGSNVGRGYKSKYGQPKSPKFRQKTEDHGPEYSSKKWNSLGSVWPKSSSSSGNAKSW